MEYAPHQYKRCTHCRGVITIRPLLKVEAHHAQLWSDGYIDSPLVAEQPLATKCPHCKAPVWIPALTDLLGVDPAKAGEYVHFTLDELWQLLSQTEGMEHAQLLYLRIKVWQGTNHRLRHDVNVPVNYSEREIDNMQQLLSMLDPKRDEERLMIGELLREMGRFGEARAVLSVQFDDLVQVIAEQLLSLIEASEQRVALCNTPVQACAPVSELRAVA